jgi:para-nitrobenzyl esterase
MNIPFAAPPTGELRWSPPQPVEPWEEVRDASEPGGACIQGVENDFQQTRIESSEDCLYLNVWTPELTPAEPLPVMLWLHGGGNINGGAVEHSSEGGMMSWDGQRFIEAASRPVVVVTANYRLGVLGFLAHAGLTQVQGSSGNYGLMDQQAALRWVHANISAFGGDPDNVTLFGESAGAEDICLHLVAPESADLFHRAILESAPQAISGLFRWDLDRGEDQGAAFADLVDCSGADDTEVVACLRGLPVEELYKIVETDTLPGGLLYDTLPLSSPLGFQAIIDGVVVPKLVADAIAANQHAKVPVIVGTNVAEGILLHDSLLGSIPVADED